MRYQTAIPLSAIRGDDVGFRFGRNRRRRLRQEAKRIVQRERDAQLEPLPVPTPTREPREPSREDRDWGPLTRLGQQMRVQARRGYRAAVVELQPGMYLVAEVPEDALKPEVGVVPLLAPLLTMAAARALKKRKRHEQEPEPTQVRRVVEVVEPQVIYEPPPPRQLPGPTVARWADPNDVQTVLAGCGCRRCSGG
ncbi:MAG: hypothetical protein H6738_24490 [Alphaproteobacteria bacterium]|nr:hypothetical protein [Alphaproteobacteria bacterium]MCB9699969.1 hypothetical protein [Alphaproteobacteria bacterium]